MITHNSFTPETLNLFWFFIAERQNIWMRRFIQRQAPPWTEDPVLREERFTNVYRELDPGTIYAVEHILETDTAESDRIFNVMMYRLVGRSETHQSLGFQRVKAFDPEYFVARLRWIRDVCHHAPFTAAYMVSGYTQMGSTEKAVNIARLFTQLAEHFSAFHRELTAAASLPDAYAAIRRQAGFGNFLAYQITIDLLYPLRRNGGRSLLPFSPDDWASAGPGASRGIHMLLKPGTQANDLAVMRWLRRHQHDEFTRLGITFAYLSDDRGGQCDLSLANIQNCLCEFHKYVKIQSGTGRGRRKFAPRAANTFQLPLHFRVPE
jgi:hypothetical protein